MDSNNSYSSSHTHTACTLPASQVSLQRRKKRLLSVFKYNIYKEISNTIIKKLIYYNISGVFSFPIGSSSLAYACGGSLALMDAGKESCLKTVSMLHICFISTEYMICLDWI